MSALSRTLAQVRFDTATTLRNGEQVLLLLLLPVLALVGLDRVGSIDLGGTPEQRTSLALAGALAVAVAAAGLTSQAISLAFDRRWGVLRLLATTPLGPRGLLLGRIGAMLCVLVVQVLVLCAAALVLGWRPTLGEIAAGGPLALLTLLAGGVTFTALGVIIGGTLRPEAVLALANGLWALLAVAGGLLVPVDSYPAPLRVVVELLPSGALGNALRSIAAGPFDWLALGILAVWGAALSLVAMRVVRWEE